MGSGAGDFCLYRGRDGTVGVAKLVLPGARAVYTTLRIKELEEALGRGRSALTPRAGAESEWPLVIPAIARAHNRVSTRGSRLKLS